MTDAKPTLTPRQLDMFSDWCVRAVWPNGQERQVHGFSSEAHARGWIKTLSAEWIAQMEADPQSGLTNTSPPTSIDFT